MPTVDNFKHSLDMCLRVKSWMQRRIVDCSGQLAVRKYICETLRIPHDAKNHYRLTSVSSDRASKVSVDRTCKTVMSECISCNTTRAEVLR
jgi:hypothetical protein